MRTAQSLQRQENVGLNKTQNHRPHRHDTLNKHAASQRHVWLHMHSVKRDAKLPVLQQNYCDDVRTTSMQDVRVRVRVRGVVWFAPACA